MAACPAGELGLQVGKSNVVTPLAGVDHDGMSALVIGTVHNEPGRAGLAHLPEGDLLFAMHAPNSAENRAQPDYCNSLTALAACPAGTRDAKEVCGRSRAIWKPRPQLRGLSS